MVLTSEETAPDSVSTALCNPQVALGSASPHMSATDFRALFDLVSNWSRWGKGDERGALHLLTPDRITAAAKLVRSGATVSLSRPLDTERRPDNPQPADHHMTMLIGEDGKTHGVGFAKDYIGIDCHNDGHSHIDALCHVAFAGALYGGRPDVTVTSEGAEGGTIETLRNGRSEGSSARYPSADGGPVARTGRPRLPRGPSRRRGSPTGAR